MAFPQADPRRSTFATSTSSKPAHLQPLLFEALAPDGSNFLEWNNDITTYLSAEDLADTLSPETAAYLPPIFKLQLF